MLADKFVNQQTWEITTTGNKDYNFFNVGVYDKTDYTVYYIPAPTEGGTPVKLIDGTDYQSKLTPATPEGQQPPASTTIALNLLSISILDGFKHSLDVGNAFLMTRQVNVKKLTLFDKSTYYTVDSNNYATEVLQLAVHDLSTVASNGVGSKEGSV